MLLLSRLTGRQVRGSDGRPVGRLTDLSVRLDSETPLVEQLVVTGHGSGAWVLPWNAAAISNERVVLNLAGAELARYQTSVAAGVLAADEILLKRDVLDTQVVDVVGLRLARVADVVLARTAAGRLRAIGVEVGFGGVLRRLRLGGARIQDLVAWSDLHLTSERGHRVQLATPRGATHHLDARGLAALVSRVDTASASDILAGEEPAVAAAAVRTAHPEVGERVLRAMADAQSSRIVAEMPAEHAGRWRARLSRVPGRRFLRSRVFARRHLRRPRR